MLASENYVKNLLEIYRPELHKSYIQITGHDPGACAMSNGAIVLWLHGYPDQAHQRALKGLTHCNSLEHPFSAAFGRWGTSCVALYSGDISEAVKGAQENLAFSEENELPLFIISSKVVLGAALVKQGKDVEGRVKIQEGQKLIEETNSLVGISYALSEFLMACLLTDAVQDVLDAVESELENHPITGQRWLESEIRRLYGELMLADDPDRIAEAEAEFHLAIEFSQQQHAKSLELRAVMSLSRLWQKQGKIKQAHERLSEIYNWFTEGFDTKDLREAKALLDALNEEIHFEKMV